jgi:hypothetical protein
MWTARPEQHLGESGLSRRFRRPALSTGLLSRRGIKRIRDEAGLYQNRQAGPRQKRRLQHQGRRRSWHRGKKPLQCDYDKKGNFLHLKSLVDEGKL